MNHVVDETPIGRNFKNMCTKDRESLRVKLNSAYYLAKHKKPFTDFPELLKLQSKNKVMYIGESYTTDRAAAKFVNVIGQITRESLNADLAKARYYSILNDGSTDVSTTEQELVYVLFLQDGTPVIKFMGVESQVQADAEGLQTAIETSFSRLGISCFPDRLVGLNIDGASVNMGVHAGLGAKVCETALGLFWFTASTIVLSLLSKMPLTLQHFKKLTRCFEYFIRFTMPAQNAIAN